MVERPLKEAARALPAGTVTFLFTDIEGSTRLLRELGDDYATVHARHQRLLREAFGRHGGVEVDTQGDSFFVAFGDARAALAAAEQAQTALAGEHWPRQTSVRVRMGLHSGRPLLAGDHYVGIDVVRGARIAAAAHGGQVLVSQDTRNLVNGDGELPLALRELGAHRLKDLPERERIFQLVIAGLPASFPPPRVQEDAVASARLPDYSLPPADVPCPYKGLEPFQLEDTALFFGREELVAELAARLERTPILAVVGPSGSGKSSLVRAGLLPELTRQATIITPGTDPLAELAAAGDTDLLVCDQFEELFTLCRDEGERRSFIDALLEHGEDGRQVIVAMRADFYGYCAAYPALAAALQEHHVLVGPMSEEEVRRAIERPAEQAGLLLEPGLAEAILRDVVGEPGALPLLSHSLLETWKRRSDRMLSLIGYLQAGGVHGAIAKTAQTVYAEALSAEQRALARGIFLRLTEVGEHTEPTRRRASIAELTPRAGEAAAVEEVLRLLAEARLITIGEETVELAHEALIGHWPTLRGWLDEDREGRVLHRGLTQAAQEWQKLSQDPGALYRGARLAGVSDWAAGHDDELNELERAFLAASRQAELNEIETTRRRNSRLRVLVAALAILLVAAVGAGAVALVLREQAKEEARIAKARELAAAAQANLDVDPERSILLAIEAVQTARQHGAGGIREAEQILHEALAESRVLLSVPGVGHDVDFSPDGRRFVAADADGKTASVRDAESGEALLRLTGHSGEVLSVEYSRDGKLIATASDDGVAMLWDAGTGRAIRTIDARVRRVFTARFSPEGDKLVTLGGDSASVWDVESGRRLARIGRVLGGAARSSTGNAEGVAFLPGSRLAVARGPERADGVALRVLDALSAEEQLVVESDGSLIDDLDASSDGSLVAVGENSGEVTLWRLPAAHAFDRVGTRQEVSDFAFSADGRLLATAGRDGSIRIWDVTPTGALERHSLYGHVGPVSRVAFSGDGTLLVSSGVDGYARVWDVSPSGRGEALTLPGATGSRGPGGVEFASNERIVATSRVEGDVRTWDLSTRQLLAARPGLACSSAEVMDTDLSPDGSNLATGCADGYAYIFDLETGEQLASLFVGGWVLGVAFSPDGSRLAAAGDDGSALIFDVKSGGELRQLASKSAGTYEGEDVIRVHGVAWSPDGDRVLAMGLRTTSVWDTRTGRLVHELPAGAGVWGSRAAWTRDGTNLLLGGTSGVDIWDAEAGERAGQLVTGETGPLAISPDGLLVALLLNDNTTRIWDWRTGDEVLTLPSGGQRLAFSPDGRLLAVQRGSGVHVYALDVDRLLEIARSRVTRALTAEECHEYLHVETCPRRD